MIRGDGDMRGKASVALVVGYMARICDILEGCSVQTQPHERLFALRLLDSDRGIVYDHIYESAPEAGSVAIDCLLLISDESPFVPSTFPSMYQHLGHDMSEVMVEYLLAATPPDAADDETLRDWYDRQIQSSES